MGNRMIRWNDELWLFTPEELLAIPPGTQLKNINGKFVLASDQLDLDTRFGVTVYGITEQMAVEQGLKNEFLIWLIKK